MARALARGWGRPVACFDPQDDRARALADELGGRAMGSSREVADASDLLVLAHKPAQLGEVAVELGEGATGRAVASILAATPLADLRAAYPDSSVYRFLPSLPVEVRRGAIVEARGSGAGANDGPTDLDEAVTALFEELGMLVVLDESLVDVAMGLMSCAPAYVALVAEAQIDAGVRRGSPPPRALRWWSRRWRGPPSCCAPAATTRWRFGGRSRPPGASPRGASTRSSEPA